LTPTVGRHGCRESMDQSTVAGLTRLNMTKCCDNFTRSLAFIGGHWTGQWCVRCRPGPRGRVVWPFCCIKTGCRQSWAGGRPMRCAKVSGQRWHVGCGVPAAQMSWVMWRRQRGRLSRSPTRAVAWFVWSRPPTRRVHSNTRSADCAVEISKFSRIHGVVHQQ
jgi:hypothetical protein